MEKISGILIGLILIFGLAGIANATPYIFDMGGDSWVDTSGTNDVLKMYANTNPDLDDTIFGLEENESYTFYFATFGTNEGWINNDDVNPGALTAYVNFDNPALTQAIGGTSIGFSTYCHFTQGWNLIWDDPVVVNFGEGGQFAIELSDVGYASWFWQGPDGYDFCKCCCHPGTADVYTTVTLDSIPVHVPGTLILLGSGLIGLASFRNRFKR